MKAKARDARIDIVRGVAMLTILINHITGGFRIYGFDGVEILTPTSVGYASAAPLFVIMSGYMVGMVYLRKAKPAVAILKRASTLYAYNTLLLASLLPGLIFMSDLEVKSWGADFIVNGGLLGWTKFLALWKAPMPLDVLRLYVISMLLTPAAIWVYRRSPMMLAAGSIAIWLVCQLAAVTRFIDPGTVRWGFNAAAWQLLFFIPLILGASRAHESFFGLLENRKWLTFAVAAAAVALAAAKIHQADSAFPGSWYLSLKGNLGPLRLAHACIMLALYCGLLSLSARIPELPPMRALACLGRQTLKCYVLSVWLTYVLAVTWGRLGSGNWGYYAAVASVVVVTFLAAAIFENPSTRHAKLMKPEPAL